MTEKTLAAVLVFGTFFYLALAGDEALLAIKAELEEKVFLLEKKLNDLQARASFLGGLLGDERTIIDRVKKDGKITANKVPQVFEDQIEEFTGLLERAVKHGLSDGEKEAIKTYWIARYRKFDNFVKADAAQDRDKFRQLGNEIEGNLKELLNLFERDIEKADIEEVLRDEVFNKFYSATKTALASEMDFAMKNFNHIARELILSEQEIVQTRADLNNRRAQMKGLRDFLRTKRTPLSEQNRLRRGFSVMERTAHGFTERAIKGAAQEVKGLPGPK